MGPTASGKSALAMELARRLGDVEIVSVDSMQVYRGMDIGTAKPSPADRAELPHHLLDLAEPTEEFSVARFQAAFKEAIAGIESRGHRALLVGGTGLYLRAAVDDLTLPGEFRAVRAELEQVGETTALHSRLAALDPVAAGRMEPANRRRVVRALEVTLGSGRPFSSFGPGLEEYPRSRFRLAGIALDHAVVHDRIERRFASMMAAGLVDEVRSLVARHGCGLSRTARQALGYRELLAHVESGVPLEQAAAEAVRRTRAFARRQRAWFRRDPRITWHAAQTDPLEVLPALEAAWS